MRASEFNILFDNTTEIKVCDFKTLVALVCEINTIKT